MGHRADAPQKHDAPHEPDAMAAGLEDSRADARDVLLEDMPVASISTAASGDGTAYSSSEAFRAQVPLSSTEVHMRRMYAAQAVKQKDHISAGLLAIFLGMFGIHKFYLGYNQAAFAMLAVTVIGSIVTLGLAGAVMWVISIIEGIIYLTKTQTEFDKMYVLDQREWF